MKPRTLLVLFLLVAGLGAFIWFVERDLPSSDERVESARRLLDVEPEKVTAVVVTTAAGRLRLERGPAGDGGGPGEWRLTEPLIARADGEEVASLLSGLAELEKQRTLDDPGDDGELGLTAPRAEVTLEQSGRSVTLRLGAEVPASEAVIVAVDGRAERFVVEAGPLERLTRPAGDWRDRQLFPGARADIGRIALSREGGERLLLARRGDAFWLEAPRVDRAGKAPVDELLGTLTELSAESFLDEAEPDLGALGLEPPRARLEVVLTSRDEPVEVLIGDEVPADGSRRFARVDGQIVEIGRALDGALERSVESWRSLALSAMAVYQVDSIELLDGEGEVTLERAGGDWQRGDDRIDYTPVSDFLYALTSVEAEQLAPADGGTGEPLRTVTLRGADGEETLSFYAPRDGLVPARTASREALLLLPASVFEEIEVRIAELRSAEAVSEADLSGDSATD